MNDADRYLVGTENLYFTDEVIMPTESLPESFLASPPLLTRAQAAVYLTGHGFPIGYRSLAILAVKGDGPLYRRWGKFAMYDPADLLQWAEERAGTHKRRRASEVVV